jgi:hypothetical protein
MAAGPATGVAPRPESVPALVDEMRRELEALAQELASLEAAARLRRLGHQGFAPVDKVDGVIDGIRADLSALTEELAAVEAAAKAETLRTAARAGFDVDLSKHDPPPGPRLLSSVSSATPRPVIDVPTQPPAEPVTFSPPAVADEEPTARVAVDFGDVHPTRPATPTLPAAPTRSEPVAAAARETAPPPKLSPIPLEAVLPMVALVLLLIVVLAWLG